MVNNENIIKYDIHELDLYDLQRQVSNLGVKSLIVYGVGNNGGAAFRVLSKIGVDVKYFVDVKANEKLTFFHKKVLSPSKLLSGYTDEYVLVTPSIHDDIVEWLLKSGIPKEKLILPFYQLESISINYGCQTTSPSDDIDYCKIRPAKPAATFMTIAYNTPEYMFRRAIESVLQQTYRDFIYVIVVNGATDDTLIIANEYADLDARVLVVNLDKNYRWTEEVILKTIKENIFGEYWCQLDSDDYYDEKFLEITMKLANENKADIVCTRTCLFASDKNYNLMTDGLVYDWHDKYYFNIFHPECHIVGRQNIITAYAKSKICSVFWGKLYSSSLMCDYLDYLFGLTIEERELYYRLDISMTYKVLSMSERVYYSDKVLHFSQYSKGNSTFSLSPIEWLMSLWSTYSNIKQEMYLYYEKRKAKKYSKLFLQVHLPWMIKRKGMLQQNIQESVNYERILQNLKDMYKDDIITSLLLRKTGYMKEEYRQFYEELGKLAKSAEETI